MIATAATGKTQVHESVNGRYRVTSSDFLDSVSLFRELRERTSDYLASGLIGASPVLSHTYFPDFEKGGGGTGKWATGTRVLPVYIFSIMEELRPLIFDTKLPYAVSKEAVLVVQTGDTVALPYFTGQRQLTASYRDPTASVISGVGAALGGLMPPHRRFSQEHQRVVSDYTWSHGYFSWGPFSNATGLSQVAIDSILMNSVVSRLDSSVERVTDALLRMDDFADRFLSLPPPPPTSLSKIRLFYSWSVDVVILFPVDVVIVFPLLTRTRFGSGRRYLYDPLGVAISEGKPLGLLERLQKRGAGDTGSLLVSYETLRELHDDVTRPKPD